MNPMKMLRLITGPLLQASAASSPSHMQWTVPVDITAAGDGESGEKTPTFALHAYTGGAMRLPGIYLPVVLDLNGGRTTAGQVKILRDHDRSRILGHAQSVDVNAQGIFVKGPFSGDEDEVAKVTGPSKRGFEWEASIGASGERMERLEEGRQTTVNGRTVTGPLYIARQWALKEVSFVAIGADENTTTSIAAADSGDHDMNFEQWLKAHGFDPNTIGDGVKTALRAQYDADLQAAGGDASKLTVPTTAGPGNTPPAPPSPANTPPASPTAPTAPAAPLQASAPANAPAFDLTATQQAMREEHVRINEITRICAAHGDMTIDVNGSTVSLAAHAIQAGWPVDKVELHCLREARPQAPAGIIMRDNQQLNASAVEAAMCISAGFGQTFLEGQYDEQTLEAADSRHLRGIGIQGLMRLCLHANGGHYGFMNVNNDMIEATFRADPMLNGSMSLTATGFSTISLAGILSNLANKAMLERYQQAESVWREIASVTSTNNFKPFTRYRLDSTGKLQEVGPDGELKHIQLTETEFINRLKTEGGILALTRQMMIDDDMGAFLQIPQIFGELSAYALEETTFKRLLAAIGSFFAAGKGNYISGADTALSIEGLTKAVTKFRQKKGPGGRYAMIRPALLLTGSPNEAVADQIFTSTQLGDGSTTKQKPKDNPHRGKFKPVVSPFMDANGLPGGSDTHWALLAKPTAGSGVVQVAFLNGRDQPVIESAQANFNQLGLQFRSFHDFGIREFDENAGVWSKGAA